ncbi:hypothetical protein [Ignatzschineria sp. LJL83]
MKKNTYDNELINFYQKLSLCYSFKEINLSHTPKEISLKSRKFTDSELFDNIQTGINNLQSLGIEKLLQYRMNVYQQNTLETIPILKSLNLSLETLEHLDSVTKIKQALLNLIDYTIFTIAVNDKSHTSINEIREYIFTLEDYCLQIEHTKDLRERCQTESTSDILQVKLEEDLQKMSCYLKHIEDIYEILLLEIKKAS